MYQTQHIQRIRNYYFNSRFGYRYLLWGSQHFGFYPKNRNVSEKEAQVLMQDLIGKKLNLSNSMKVLDAGCGRGIVANYLANKFGCSIGAIDITPMLVEEAKAKDLDGQNVNFSLMDYSHMSFSDDYFDAIYTLETLCHSADVSKTLKEFYRVLKKGGKIALFEYTIAEDNKFSTHEMDMLRKVINGAATEGLFNFRHRKFQNLIKQAGFRKVKVKNITNNILPSLNRLRKYLFVPYLFVKISNSQLKYPNPTIAVEWYKLMEKGLWRYNIFTATK